MLPVASDAPAEMDIGKHGHTGFVEETFAEFLRIGAAGALAGFGDVRPGIERAAGRLAVDARNLVEQPDDQITPLEKRLAHRLRGILRAGDRLDRRPLADLRSARLG